MTLRNTSITVIGALILAITTQFANAGGMNHNEEAFLVPFATFSDRGLDTVVRLRTRAAGRVYWAFFDSNGNRVADDSIRMEDDSTYAFIWSSEAEHSAQFDLRNLEGYLVFGLDSNSDGAVDKRDSDTLSGNAMVLNREFGNQLLYLPILGLDGLLEPKFPDQWSTNPVRVMNETLATKKASKSQQILEFQFSEQSGLDGIHTRLYVWSTLPLGGTQTAELISESGSRKTINLPLRNNHLNVIDIAELHDFDRTYLGDGYLRWQIPQSDGSLAWVYAFTTVSSRSMVLSQTLMGIVGYPR